MSAPAPDLTGFADAQARLVQAMGRDVTFQIPVAPVYDPDVQLDPQTGRPFDPVIEPTSGGGYTEVVKRVGVVFRAIKRFGENSAMAEPIGEMTDQVTALIVLNGDYADVQNATHFALRNFTYKIVQWGEDPDVTDRYIAYGEPQ